MSAPHIRRRLTAALIALGADEVRRVEIMGLVDDLCEIAREDALRHLESELFDARSEAHYDGFGEGRDQGFTDAWELMRSAVYRDMRGGRHRPLSNKGAQ